MSKLVHSAPLFVLAALTLGGCDLSPRVNALPVATVRPQAPIPPASASWHQISFEPQSFTLKDKDRAILDQVATEALNKPGSIITVIGRIDPPGSPEDIQNVAQRRFENVRDTLIYRGNVSPDRIQTLRTTDSPRSGAAGRHAVDIAVN